MDTPYQPPGAELEPATPNVGELDWVRYTRWTLWFCGGVYALLGVVMVPGFAWLMTLEGEAEALPAPIALGFGLIMLLVGVGFGALNGAAAWGLARGHKWGWILGVVLGGIYAPSGCLPFGVIILYGLLNERVRKAYLG